jgi:hypothetical protein
VNTKNPPLIYHPGGEGTGRRISNTEVFCRVPHPLMFKGGIFRVVSEKTIHSASSRTVREFFDDLSFFCTFQFFVSC